MKGQLVRTTYKFVRGGSREVRRSVKHFNLEAILAVGFRVRTRRGAQFRRYSHALGDAIARQPAGGAHQGGSARLPRLSSRLN
jgi:hypothetical protein